MARIITITSPHGQSTILQRDDETVERAVARAARKVWPDTREVWITDEVVTVIGPGRLSDGRRPVIGHADLYHGHRLAA